jgi:hypothetical protein
VTPDELKLFLQSQGYASLSERGAKLCGLQSLMFTTGLVVGLEERGYERRYCFEHLRDAASALKQWDGSGHPPGPWIKCKGPGIDMLNPAFGEHYPSSEAPRTRER